MSWIGGIFNKVNIGQDELRRELALTTETACPMSESADAAYPWSISSILEDMNGRGLVQLSLPGGGMSPEHPCTDYQEKLVLIYDGHLYNLEATPAEGATYRMAKKDREIFKDIIQAGTPEAPYYTNSSQLPVGLTADLIEALDLQESLQRKYTGGTVFHAYIGEPLSKETTRKLVKRILENYQIPYLTVTPTFSICPSHGYIPGEHHTCPQCNATCEVWTRVMGYFRPVSQYNPGKKSEFGERRYFAEQPSKEYDASRRHQPNVVDFYYADKMAVEPI